MPEWSNGLDLGSSVLSAYLGSNPSPRIRQKMKFSELLKTMSRKDKEKLGMWFIIAGTLIILSLFLVSPESAIFPYWLIIGFVVLIIGIILHGAKSKVEEES